MRHHCRSCGAEGDDAAAFVRTGAWPRRKERCHPCDAAGELRRSLRTWKAAAAIALPAVAIAAMPYGWLENTSPLREPAILLVNGVALGAALQLASLFVHELAHAAAAALLGFRVFLVQIGLGPRWKRLRLLGLPFELAAPPTGGSTWAAHAEEVSRIRHVLVYLAGPLTHVGWLVLAYILAESLGDRAFAYRTQITPVPALLWIHGTTLARFFMVSRQASDVWLAISMLTASRVQLAAFRAYAWIVPARLALRDDEPHRARDIVRAGVRSLPDVMALEVMEALLTASVGDADAGIAALRTLRERADGTASDRAFAENALAWALLNRGRPETFAETDALTGGASAPKPTDASGMALRAGVLARRGALDEAWSLLAQAIRIEGDRFDRAETLCQVAMVEAERGRPSAARRRLHEARALGASSRMRALAEKSLTGVDGAPPETP